MKKMIVMVFFIFGCYTSSAMSKDFGAWVVKDGGNYRFAEQYGLQEDLIHKTEPLMQRLDFTYYSGNDTWEMTLTTRLLAESKDLIILTIDDKKYVFSGGGCCHKQAFDLNKTTIDQIKNSDAIVVEEYYIDKKTSQVTAHYKSNFSAKGSFAALLWVSDY